MSSYDDGEHTPKLLPCSHTLCRGCLQRIAATSVPLAAGAVVSTNGIVQSSLQQNASHNSLSRTVAAADSAAAIVNSTPFNSQAINLTTPVIEHFFRCPICRETIALPRSGGVSALPPRSVLLGLKLRVFGLN